MRKDRLPGGLADKKDYSKFDQEQLSMGKKVEMEHTNDPKLSNEIAGDHLAEIPDYYTRLDEMESEAETDWQPLESEREEDVLIAVNPDEELSIMIRTPSGKYENHKFPNDKPLNKPVKVNNYNRKTGHVQQHYRNKRMK